MNISQSIQALLDSARGQDLNISNTADLISRGVEALTGAKDGSSGVKTPSVKDEVTGPQTRAPDAGLNQKVNTLWSTMVAKEADLTKMPVLDVVAGAVQAFADFVSMNTTDTEAVADAYVEPSMAELTAGMDVADLFAQLGNKAVDRTDEIMKDDDDGSEIV
ncbi:MAG: hypothetical protein ABII18_13905 [bacterium]|nr:hypothetical protein [bacterium]MBU1917619.1 hypothetical protein [bacterium]